jgi:hypothetical protein
VNPAVGTTETVFDGIFNGADVLSSPYGKLGLDDGCEDCCCCLSSEITLGPIEGKKLSECSSSDG